jgi:hypothetical protein
MVLGTHRSGTSVVAHVLEALGLQLCTGEERAGGDAANPAGYFESRTIVACNDLLLAAADARWWCPPRGREWAVALRARPVAEALANAFRGAHAGGPWACKDPRLCLTADLWWRALGIPRVAVVVLRGPLEVAQSLERWHHFAVPYGLALWERCLRETVLACAGAAVYVDEYERLVADPEAWCGDLAGFLDSIGMAPAGDHLAAARVVQPALRRQVVPGPALDESGIVSERQRDLFRALRARRGGHRCWEGPPLGPEPGMPEALFQAARRSPAFGEPRQLVLDGRAAGWTAVAPVEGLRAVLGERP